jgi:hypothetical protein
MLGWLWDWLWWLAWYALVAGGWLAWWRAHARARRLQDELTLMAHSWRYAANKRG